MRHGWYKSGFFAVLLIAAPLAGQAAVYKCKDADGKISYSQTACAQDESIAKIMSLESGIREHDVQCGIVRNFAFEVGLANKEGKNINELAMEYGGEGALSTIVVDIMRSVYQYQSQPYKTIEDSVAREGEICKSERYGVPSCVDFPVKFVTEYGGCGSAGDSHIRLKKMADVRLRQTADTDNQQMRQRLAKAGEDAHARDQARRDSEACLQAVDNDLKRNAAQARQSQQASSQDQFRRERRELMSRRQDC